MSPSSKNTRDQFDQAKSSESSSSSTTNKNVTSKPKTSLQLFLIVLTCTTAMILNTANSTAVSIALPTIGRDLNIIEYKLQWMVSAYSLSAGCLLLFLGRVADLYGRKIIFLVGITILGAFGLGCGFAHDAITIFILRGLQGIGAAAVIPASLGILAHSFPPSRARSIAFATFGAGAPIGAALGSLIGGVLTQLTAPSWRSTFYLLSGLCLITFFGALVSFDWDVIPSEIDRRIDWLGAFLITAGLVLIVFVLSDGSLTERGWKTSYIIALLIVGVFFVLLFLYWQYHLEQIQNSTTFSSKDKSSSWSPPPLMKLSVWKRANGRLAVMMVIGFLEWCSFLSWGFWVQLYYQDFLQLSPVLTMVRLLPMFVTGVICNMIVALFVGRVPFVILIVIGTALTAVANLLFALIKVDSPYWAFGFPAAILSVFGADFVFAAGSLFVAKVSLPHEQSVSGALLQTMMQLGAAFGLAITTIIFNSEATKSFNRDSPSSPIPLTGPPPPPTDATPYKTAMWGGFAFGICGSLLAAVFLRGVGIVGHRNTDTETKDKSSTDGDVNERLEEKRDFDEEGEVGMKGDSIEIEEVKRGRGREGES
ncbi:major facilitator superfamily domain-containing protein [Abortiporus biennis]|nr:major facilitator superfamily domain-containing protein [Abortiporus biennis]